MPIADALADINGADPRVTNVNRQQARRSSTGRQSLSRASATRPEVAIQIDREDLELLIDTLTLIVLIYIAYKL